ncbi:PPOX class F420-dependent oxidoreductase [Kineococcus sp. R8]|uniref:PPOX class F420-dependent oxidoreductase n=1 Tax=Kineococcus siccus TaxID=2696567 RepID=UPI0014132CF4|nr:PPOX class F420-dependent oxidoreductase [Kineococcus siccus]NAZ84177.1 PPOX class F420-dependent oxidoreductase [Kineococcus siccus]
MTTSPSAQDLLAATNYVLLTTFRKDGRAVPTPIWVAPLGGRMVAYTGADSGKVKRIRRDGRVLLAPCTSRGAPLGDSVEGRASVLPAGELTAVRAAVAAKYGLVYRGFQLLQRLAGLVGRGHADAETVALELRVGSSPA